MGTVIRFPERVTRVDGRISRDTSGRWVLGYYTRPGQLRSGVVVPVGYRAVLCRTLAQAARAARALGFRRVFVGGGDETMEVGDE